MTNNEKPLCRHLGCACPVVEGIEYCCESCRTAEELEERGEANRRGCHCQHPDCAAEVEVIADALVLLEASQILASA